MKIRTIFYALSLLLSSFLLGNSPNYLPHKTEVKFVIPNLEEIPSPLIEALLSGTPHPDLLRRGALLQQYVTVTRKNIFKIFRELQAANIPFGSDENMSAFLFPGKAQEIRLLRKTIKEGSLVKTIYQIGLQGNGAVSSDLLETPDLLTPLQMEKIKLLFEDLQPEVSGSVQKIYFECSIQNPSELLVEVDVFLSYDEGKAAAHFIDGEIKFHGETRKQAIANANAFRNDCSIHPHFFGQDVTENPFVKARNIAVTPLPGEISSSFENFAERNAAIVAAIQQEYASWADPEIIALAFQPLEQKKRLITKRVLMNAEAFGFGPSAAIAEFFPYLREGTSFLGYIGSGHTLNIQNKLPYDRIYDLGTVIESERFSQFAAIAKDYDVFITASDFEMARLAKEAGLIVLIYDPLTWYWPNIPEIVRDADLYIAQNFFGVAERLKCESEEFPESIIVPPIVSELPGREPTNTLLVNLGGLSNPFMNDADFQAFANVVLGIIYDELRDEFDKLCFVTSQKIAESIKGPFAVTTKLPSEVQEILSRSRLAIMTSGLGNIYEASTMGKKVAWLPPGNDSQGQQISLLKQHHMIDFSIDWSDLVEDEPPIDYFSPQKEVLMQIASCMRKLSTDKKSQAKFSAYIRKLNTLSAQKKTSLSKLPQTFEVGGAKIAAESILQWLADHP